MAKQQQDEISIDGHFVRFGSKSYALDKINSVEVRTSPPGSVTPAIVVAVLGGAAALKLGAGGIVLGLLLGAAALALYRKSRRQSHQLFLMTSSGEAQAIQSYDGAQVDAFRRAIEDAMRGVSAIPAVRQIHAAP